MSLSRRSFILSAGAVTGARALIPGAGRAPEDQSPSPGSKKLLIYNEAGWELGQRNTSPMSVRDVERNGVDKVAGSGVRIYQLSLLTGNVAAMHRSRILEPYASSLRSPYKIHMWRLLQNIRALAEQGTDFLEVVINRCRQVGIEPHASFRVNDPHHTYKNTQRNRPGLGKVKYTHEYLYPDLRSPWIDANPQLWLPDGGFDFSHEEVRARKLAVLRELLDNYDIDGLELDFTRIPPFFRDGEKQKGEGLMTAWVEQVRQLVDAKGRHRGRPLRLTVRVEFDPEVNRAEGLDVESWVRKGLVEIVCLGVIGDATPDAPADWFIQLCRGTGCLVCPSLEGFFYWVGDALGAVRTTSVENARAAAATYFLAGADGLQMFNFCAVDKPWEHRIVEELADPDRFAFADKHYVFTLWPGALECLRDPWLSKLVLYNDEEQASLTVRLGDDFERARSFGVGPVGKLKLQVDALNRKDDLLISWNGVPCSPRPESQNQFAWDSFSVDVVYFDVPNEALRKGDNVLQIKRQRRLAGFEGLIEFQSCELEVVYPREVPSSRLI